MANNRVYEYQHRAIFSAATRRPGSDRLVGFQFGRVFFAFQLWPGEPDPSVEVIKNILELEVKLQGPCLR